MRKNWIRRRENNPKKLSVYSWKNPLFSRLFLELRVSTWCHHNIMNVRKKWVCFTNMFAISLFLFVFLRTTSLAPQSQLPIKTKMFVHWTGNIQVLNSCFQSYIDIGKCCKFGHSSWTSLLINQIVLLKTISSINIWIQKQFTLFIFLINH